MKKNSNLKLQMLMATAILCAVVSLDNREVFSQYPLILEKGTVKLLPEEGVEAGPLTFKLPPNVNVYRLNEHGKIDAIEHDKFLNKQASGVPGVTSTYTTEGTWSGSAERLILQIKTTNNISVHGETGKAIKTIESSLIWDKLDMLFKGTATFQDVVTTKDNQFVESKTRQSKWAFRSPSGNDTSEIWAEIADMASEKPSPESISSGDTSRTGQPNGKDNSSTPGDKDESIDITKSTNEALETIKEVDEAFETIKTTNAVVDGIEDTKDYMEIGKGIRDVAENVIALGNAKTVDDQIKTLRDLAKLGSTKINPGSVLDWGIGYTRDKMFEDALTSAEPIGKTVTTLQEQLEAELKQNLRIKKHSAAAKLLDKRMDYEMLADRFANHVEHVRAAQGDAAARKAEAQIRNQIKMATRGLYRADSVFSNLGSK